LIRIEHIAAAQSLAAFYKSSKQTVKHAHDAGYAECLQDILQFIQTGLSTASAENDAMGVARVMDWVEGQLDRYREGKDFDARAESADEASGSTFTSVPRRSPSPPRQPTRETVEPRSPNQTPRRASTSSLPADVAPISVPSLALEATPPAKRRHAAITAVDPTIVRRRPRSFASPVVPGLGENRPPRRAKRSGAERERSVMVDNRVPDMMDFEDEGPRERKRSRTSRPDSTASPEP
jgi:hypothetical protein